MDPLETGNNYARACYNKLIRCKPERSWGLQRWPDENSPSPCLGFRAWTYSTSKYPSNRVDRPPDYPCSALPNAFALLRSGADLSDPKSLWQFLLQLSEHRPG